MIVVAGGTGSLGSRIVRGLRQQGRAVRVLARATSQADALRQAGAEIVLGDLKDPASLERACSGASVVITTASASRTGDDSIENVDVQGNQNLIAAAEAAGVGQFVLISTLGAASDSPVPVFRAKGLSEERLRRGTMGFTILQPNAFMDVWFPMLIEPAAFAGQPVTLVGESRRRHSFVAEADVAAFAIAAVGNPAAENQTLPIGGPEPLTLRQVVQAYEEALGRPIAVRSVAPGDPIPGLPEPIWGLAAALESFDSPVPMEELSRGFGVRLTSVREFVQSRRAG